MRQIEIKEWTTPDRLTISEGPKPVCAPGQLIIKVKAVAVSHSLWLLIHGKYQRKPKLPFVPGTFASGVVESSGDGSSRFSVGDRVLTTLEFGGFAEYAVAYEEATYPIPEGMSFARANALSTSYCSVVAALTWPRLLNVQKGERLLVTGASGGTGTAALEVGRILGATVIGTATSEAKREWVLQHGAHAASPSEATQLKERVMEVTNGEGVDAVFEPVGGAMFEQALRCLRPDGRIVPFGFAGGDIPTIPANVALVKNITIGGLNMSHYRVTERSKYAGQVRKIFEQLGHWFENGQIKPVMVGTFPLEQVSAAFDALRRRDQQGHVAVVFDD